MFKNYHPFGIVLGVILYLFAILFTQNSILLVLILLLNLWKSVKIKSNIVQKTSILGIFLVVINSFCGKLLFFVKICILFAYFYLLRDSCSQEMVTYFYENLFYRKKNNKYLYIYLIIINFLSIYKESWKEIDLYLAHIDFEKQYRQIVYKFRQCFHMSKKKLEKIYLTYQLRLYGYKSIRTSEIKIKWSEEDNTYLLLHVFLVCCVIILRRYS